jgi:hypothetical protein
MFFDDHPWPHVHVRFAEFRAVIEIDDLDMREGQLPVSVARRVRRQSAELRHQELKDNWERAENGGELSKVDPPN